MKTFLLCLLMLIATASETLLTTIGNRADRQSTYSKTSRLSKKAAFCAALFGGILALEMNLVPSVGLWLLIPVMLGEYFPMLWALERRRKKWWANAGNRNKRKRKKANPLATVLTDEPGAPPVEK